MNKLTIRDAEPAGRRLFLRVDFNVPLDSKGAISDDTRIQASLPTIRYGIEHGAKLILASHLGRPKGQPVGSMTLRPAAERLAELVRSPVAFANDCVGPEVEAQARGLAAGGYSKTFAFILRKRKMRRDSRAGSPRSPICTSMTRSAPRTARTLRPWASPSTLRRPWQGS